MVRVIAHAAFASARATMTRVGITPLAPFVDRLPLPSRLSAAERDGRLTVRMRAAMHQFHSDLPSSSIWGFEPSGPRCPAFVSHTHTTGPPPVARYREV